MTPAETIVSLSSRKNRNRHSQERPLTAPPLFLQRPLPVIERSEDPGAIRSIYAGRATILVASIRGYCHGVERALRIAEETIDRFAGRRIFLTSAILHNPGINKSLARRGVIFLDRHPELANDIGPRDIVLVPAFGVPPSVLRRLDASGAIVVDTTCGSVAFVWKHVDRLARDGFTVVYHGRPGHEEAIATLERISPGPYVLVENRHDADQLVAFLDNMLSAEQLRNALQGRFSEGFDPSTCLEHIGFANQTTMLASESLEIARELHQALARRRPGVNIDDVFRVQETICGATQERQESLGALLAEKPDLVVVVGGFDSSNTSHLADVALDAKIPAYHIEGVSDVRSAQTIRHRDPSTGEIVETTDWLPSGRIRIGASSGASTPEESFRAVLDKMAQVTG